LINENTRSEQREGLCGVFVGPEGERAMRASPILTNTTHKKARQSAGFFFAIKAV